MLETVGLVVLFVLAFVGIVSIALLLAYFIFWFSYKKRRSAIEKIPPATDKLKMPVMRPLPLNSKNQTDFNRFLLYLYVPREWELLQNWHWVYDDPFTKQKIELVVPKKFRCDVASIPRPFRALFNPSGLLLLPALLHDYAFEYNHLWQLVDGNFVKYDPPDYGSKEENRIKQKIFWDDLLYEAGMQINGSRIVNKIIRFLGHIGLSKKTWLEYRDIDSEADSSDLSGDCLCIEESRGL